MATEKEMYELLGRALTDADFRAALADDPLKAAAGLGIDLEEAQATALKSTEVSEAVEGLDVRLSKTDYYIVK